MVRMKTIYEAEALRWYLSSDWNGWNRSRLLYGKIHSVFQRTMNLEFLVPDTAESNHIGHMEKRLLTLVMEGMSLPPDSIAVSAENFSIINKDAVHAIMQEGEYLEIGGEITIKLLEERKKWYIEKGTRCHIQYYSDHKQKKKIERLKKALHVSNRRSGLWNLPERYRSGLDDFAQNIYHKRKNIAANAMCSIIGAGKGLTPSCDDAIIGVLAFFQYLPDITATYENLLQLIKQKQRSGDFTTEVSGKYLRCACRGMFAEDINGLLRAMFVPCEEIYFQERRSAVEQCGHTSGADLLYGIERAMHTVLEHV